MAKNGVSLEWRGFDKAIGNASKALTDTSKLMASIGEGLVSGVKNRFKKEEDPQGKKWPKSGRAKMEGGQTLTKTGSLRNSVDKLVDYAATATKVMVGTNAKYARIHQLGGTIKPKKAKALAFTLPSGKKVMAKSVTIPARPFIGISKDDLKEVKETINDYLTGAFKA